MTDNHVPSAGGGKTGIPTPASMAARMLVPLTVGAATSLVLHNLLVTWQPDEFVRATVSVLIGAGIAGIALATMLVRPLVRSRADLQVRYQAAIADALRDPLTGLGNHRAFQEELDSQVEHATRYGVPVSLVLIDLDEFKQINDNAGHAVGDQTLASFGRLVASVLRKVDRPFRIGGDEFALLLPHTDANGAHIVARRLLVSSLQPTIRDPKFKPLSFSAGISSMPELAASRSLLYSQADTALYAAKRAGRTEVLLFDPSEEVAASTATTSAAIADVIARNLLRPVFQPVVDLASGATLGYEGLIRPVAPAPYADPASMFAAAATTGHMVPLDMACVEAIVAAGAGLPREMFLSVNLSPRTVEAPEFSTASMLRILANHGFPPQRLVIELTEQQPITDLEGVRHKLDSCRRSGMRLAADDLGAGNAGLRLLSDLRFDIVKVDLGLVQRSSPGAPSSAVVESIVAFASRTGALVIGEGVEHEEQVSQLVQLGVTAAQGYLFSRPGPLPNWETGPRLADATTRAAHGEPVTVESDLEAWRQKIGLVTPAA
ncbi:MAG: bifunctional diguanylate cyclase/phosphodiesterase [Chloroflexota bacterium]|nr:bifunctional diguanylate cyclase/phosphodiesterase [Chloroflexota bacterium]